MAHVGTKVKRSCLRMWPGKVTENYIVMTYSGFTMIRFVNVTEGYSAVASGFELPDPICMGRLVQLTNSLEIIY